MAVVIRSQQNILDQNVLHPFGFEEKQNKHSIKNNSVNVHLLF